MLDGLERGGLKLLPRAGSEEDARAVAAGTLVTLNAHGECQRVASFAFDGDYTYQGGADVVANGTSVAHYIKSSDGIGDASRDVNHDPGHACDLLLDDGLTQYVKSQIYALLRGVSGVCCLSWPSPLWPNLPPNNPGCALSKVAPQNAHFWTGDPGWVFT